MQNNVTRTPGLRAWSTPTTGTKRGRYVCKTTSREHPVNIRVRVLNANDRDIKRTRWVRKNVSRTPRLKDPDCFQFPCRVRTFGAAFNRPLKTRDYGRNKSNQQYTKQRQNNEVGCNAMEGRSAVGMKANCSYRHNR